MRNPEGEGTQVLKKVIEVFVLWPFVFLFMLMSALVKQNRPRRRL